MFVRFSNTKLGTSNQCCKNSGRKIPQCRFIGWDVAFTEKGVELIEGNHNPGIFTLESTGSPGAYFDVIRALNA